MRLVMRIYLYVLVIIAGYLLSRVLPKLISHNFKDTHYHTIRPTQTSCQYLS